ncbi:MAG: hypothetical protein L6Q92_14415 [Phycisphaerae bacterium]|nr:hypothetical protein [Phycisphaerae bacterium]
MGALVGVGGFAVTALLGIAHGSVATFAAALQLLGGAGIWILILVQLHQVRLVEQEKFELAELERERRERLGGAGTIFKEEDTEHMDALAMARRLRSLERWFVPIFAFTVAAYLAITALRLLPDVWPFQWVVDARNRPLHNASMLAFFAGAVSFITFALSRYALGMSRIRTSPAWGVLRAGGVYFFGVAVVNLALAVTLVLAHNGYEWPHATLTTVIAALLLLLAVEIVVNFVLDLYRPRVAGGPQWVFYQSRFLGLFSEPEGFIRSAAHAVDYQFGFKVSETWFYQLLGRAVVPLMLFQGAVLYGLTCFVVVPQGQQAVVERLGLSQRQRWVADAGIGITWPWPFARTTLIPVDRIQRMELGYEHSREEQEAGKQSGPVLWASRHRANEYKLLVADRSASADAKVPVNLLSVSMPLQWRVKRSEVLDFHRQAADVEKLIEAIAYRELTRYAAHADLLELMGEGGIRAAAELKQSIQASCDRAGVGGQSLGVEIVHVGLGSVHPPTEVAGEYENQINALEQRDTKIKQGESDAIKTKMESAGPAFEQLYAAILAEEQALAAGSTDAAAKSADVERLLREIAAGQARSVCADSEEFLYRRVTLERAAADLFRVQRAAFESAPRVYMLRAYLRMTIDSLKSLKKYVVAVKDPKRVLYQMDLRPPLPMETLSQELKSFQEGGGR